MMKAARVLVLILLVCGLATNAQATCYKCRDLACFMSEGKNSWCNPISGGCIAGGTCSSGEECGEFYCGPDDQGAELQPLAAEYRLASVTVTHEKQPITQVADHRPDMNKAVLAEK